MNVKSKILKIRNLPCDGKKLDTISSKPYLFICALLSLGLILLCSTYYLFGCVVTIIASFYLFFVKNIKLVEIFDRYVFFYTNNGKDECFVLFWEDVASWNIVKGKTALDQLEIKLKNNQVITISCVSSKKIEKYFALYTQSEKNCAIQKQHA